MKEKSRFAFGDNWLRFPDDIDEDRISAVQEQLAGMLGRADLHSLTVLDIGSGSGLMSLAARRMGARVCSLDYDPKSVSCTRILRERFCSDDTYWDVEEGSILDASYVSRLGTFDIVCSWGVLHHTGDMPTALDNATTVVKPGGKLFVAIYNDQGGASRRWAAVKRLYVGSPKVLGFVILCLAAIQLWSKTIVIDTLRHASPLKRLRARERGMSLLRDLID